MNKDYDIKKDPCNIVVEKPAAMRTKRGHWIVSGNKFVAYGGTLDLALLKWMQCNHEYEVLGVK